MFLGFPGGAAGGTRRRLNPSTDATSETHFQDILAPLLAQGSGDLRRELQSLARETDPGFFFEGLMAAGMRQEAAGDIQIAAEIYGVIAQADSQENLSHRAQARLDAILGRGAAGARFEFLARHFAREASDPATLLAMTAGSMVFSLSRGAFLSRLLASPTRNLLTQGLGARALASTGAFLFEVPAFWATGKGLREFAAPGSQSWDLNTNWHELASASLSLGALKLCGFGSQSLYRRIAGPSAALRETSLQAVFHQTGMFAGILAGHRLEEIVGLRRPVDGATTLLDSAVMLLQFHVGGRLSHQALGEGWASRLRQMEARLGQLPSVSESPRPPRDSSFGLDPVLAFSGISAAPRGSESSFESLLNRPSFMMMEGEGGEGSGRSRPLRGLLQQVAERGKEAEVRRLSDLLQAFLGESGERSNSRLVEKFASRDHMEWRGALRILSEMLERYPGVLERLQSSEEMREFSENWLERPHFSSAKQIEVRIANGTPRAHSVRQHFVPELQRALFDNPQLRGWESFFKGFRGQKAFSREQRVESPTGGTRVFANGKGFGINVNFDAKGHLLLPVDIRAPYSEEQWLVLGRPEAPAPVEANQATVAAYAPRAGENPTLWAMRLLEISREGENEALEVARVLDERLRTPAHAPMVRETVERLVALTDRVQEGQGILARRYSVPGVRESLTIVSLPTTFLPEQWSRVFAEGVVQEFRRDRRPVERAIEIGSGTGWVSILAAKLGMAREVIGVDRNPHAPVVGRLNAALNGAEGIRFSTGDLLGGLPPEMRADLILACLPQVPRNGGLESLRAVADYYPSEGTYWDRYGLGLIDRALGQARDRLTPEGRVLFNLGGRPGRPILEDLMARRGFHPVLRYGQLIQQDPTTDFSELARLEANNRHRFEFFLKDDPHTSISAAEAVGHGEVYHMLYLTEGRPYSGIMRRALVDQTSEAIRLGYTQDPGSENEALRGALSEALSAEWGSKIPPEVLFVGPSTDTLLEGLLSVSLPVRAKVLWVGPPEAEVSGGARRFDVVRSSPNPNQFSALLERGGLGAVVWNLPREAWSAPETFLPFLAEAVERQIPVIVLEDHPIPSQDGAHPIVSYLSRHPEALPYVHVIQSLDRRYETLALPLALAMIPNASVHTSLARYADVTYSRASNLIQNSYLGFFQGLERGIIPRLALQGSVESVLTSSALETPVLRALSSRAAFDSSPKGTHSDPIDMSFGESDWRAPVVLQQAMLEALGRPRAELEAEARGAVADYLRESRGVQFSPEQIVLAAGVHPALGSAIRAIGQLEGRAVQVAVPQPSYGLFFPTVEIAGGRAMEFGTRAQDRFLIRPGAIPWLGNGQSASSSRASALLLNEPTNPAGQYYSAEQWREIAGTLRASRAYLLFDDVFGMLDFGRIRGRRVPSMQILQAEMGDRWVAFGGVSKEFAAGGLRFGFAATSNARLAEALRTELTDLPDPLALAAAPEYLRRWQELITPHRFYLSSKAMALEELFKERHLSVTEVQGGYAMFADLSPLYGRRLRLSSGGTSQITPQNLHELLYSEAGIKVHSEDWARVRGHYRFVFAIERIDEAIQRLKVFLRAAR